MIDVAHPVTFRIIDPHPPYPTSGLHFIVRRCAYRGLTFHLHRWRSPPGYSWDIEDPGGPADARRVVGRSGHLLDTAADAIDDALRNVAPIPAHVEMLSARP